MISTTGLRFDEETGHWSQVESMMRRRIGQYARRSIEFKIGATNNPRARWNVHQSDWNRMVTLWVTVSYDRVKFAESRLIDYARRYLHLVNLYAGGGGLSPNVGPYYLYVVTW